MTLGENELLPWHRRRWLGWNFACDWYVIGPLRIRRETLDRWSLRHRWRAWRRREARREAAWVAAAYRAGYRSGRARGQREGSGAVVGWLREQIDLGLP